MLYFEDKKKFQAFAKETDNSVRANWGMASDVVNGKWVHFKPACAFVIEGIHSENVDIEQWVDDGVISFQGRWESDYWDCDYVGYCTPGTYIFFEKLEDAIVFKLQFGTQFG